MAERTPRHHAMVDFQQHCERRWVVLEEDHLKVEKRASELEGLLFEVLGTILPHWRPTTLAETGTKAKVIAAIDAALAGQQQAKPTSAKSSPVATTPSEDGRRVLAHRLINELGEVMTDWHDGEPPENLTDLCGVAMAGVRAELAYAAQPARQVGGDESEDASDLHVWRATTKFGETCHFGEDSYARAWAGKEGKVERVDLTPRPDLTVVPGAELAPAAVVSVQICRLGAYGKAFDLPSEARAYSYEHQPDNAGAYKLGTAAGAVRVMSAGDSIDAGLNLLKALAGEGFGVFELRALLGKEGE